MSINVLVSYHLIETPVFKDKALRKMPENSYLERRIVFLEKTDLKVAKH
jgi:hypothetical protein